MNRFRGGLVFKAHKLVYHSILGWRVIEKKKKKRRRVWVLLFEWEEALLVAGVPRSREVPRS